MSTGEELRRALRRAVVIVLLGVWCFPATGWSAPTAPVHRAAPSAQESPGTSAASEAAALAARERQAPALQNFEGGGVSIYIGSGVLAVVVIVLLLIILI
jgi:hypothetical protein